MHTHTHTGAHSDQNKHREMSVQPQTPVMDPQAYTEEKSPHLFSHHDMEMTNTVPVRADLIHNEQPYYNWME